MKLSENGFEFLKSQEGVRYKSYQDSIGVWTIYIGLITFNGKKVTQGMTVTEEEGKAEFLKQIVTYENAVNNNAKTILTQNQFDALVSFTFNLGINNFKSSTLLKKVNINTNDQSIGDEFMKWNRAGNKVIDGLTKRRKAETKLYFSL